MERLLGALKSVFQHKTAKNGVIFAIFAFITQGISFILLLILANYIAPDGYGHLNLFTTFVQLFTYFVCLSCAGYISVVYFKKTRQETGLVVNTIILISICMTVLIGGLFAMFPSLRSVVGLDLRIVLIAVFICLCVVFHNMNLDIYRLEERPVPYGIISVLFCLLNFVLALYFVVVLKQDWLGRVYSQLLVAFTFAIVGIVIVMRKGFITLRKPSCEIIKETLHFGIPLIPHQVAFWVRQSFDRFVINHFLTVSVVGLYGFAFNFANIITIIGSSFNSAYSVYQFQQLSNKTENTKKNLRKISKVMLLFYALVTAIIVAGCYIFIPLLFPNYVGALPFILPLGLSALFICYYLVYVNYLFYYEKTKVLMYITTSFSVIQLLLSLMITRFGAIWTAYISAFISFCIFAFVYKYSEQVLKENNVK